MIVRNFKNSGSAVGAVNYVLSHFDANRTLRIVHPQTLRGDPELTKTIDKEFCQRFQHKSLSGVLSFRVGEALTEQQKQSLIDDFERVMFGNMRGRVNALYVEHSDKKGNRLEIHYVINRVDLKTGKFYNPFPPGQMTKELVKTFSAIKNEEFGFKPVEENPLKTKYTDNECKGNKNPRNSFRKLKSKRLIDRALQDMVKDGSLKNREDLLAFIKDNGMKMSRISSDYISIQRDGRNIRLRGGIYAHTGKDYQASTTPANKPTYSQNLHRLNEIVAIRNEYNSKRFSAKAKSKPALQNKLPAIHKEALLKHFNEPTASKITANTQNTQQNTKTAQIAFSPAEGLDMSANDSPAIEAFNFVKSATQSVSLAEKSLANALAQLTNAKTPEQQAKALQAVTIAKAKVLQAQALLAMAKKREINTPQGTQNKMRMN